MMATVPQVGSSFKRRIRAPEPGRKGALDLSKLGQAATRGAPSRQKGRPLLTHDQQRANAPRLAAHAAIAAPRPGVTERRQDMKVSEAAELCDA